MAALAEMRRVFKARLFATHLARQVFSACGMSRPRIGRLSSRNLIRSEAVYVVSLGLLS